MEGSNQKNRNSATRLVGQVKQVNHQVMTFNCVADTRH